MLEVERTIYVYRITLNMELFKLVCKVQALSMELSTNRMVDHLAHTITMSLVLFAMHLQECRCWCCQLEWNAQHLGLVNTRAICLMSTHFANHHRTMYECVDQSPDRIPGSAPNTDGAVFYHVEATCNGLPCGPYDPQKELTCAVCTK